VPPLAGTERLPKRDRPTAAHTVDPRDPEDPQVWYLEHPPAESICAFPRHEQKDLMRDDGHRSRGRHSRAL